MKFIALGDTHADATFTANVLKAAKELDIHTVVQLGDFGFSFDKNQLASIGAWLDRDETNLFYWIDGNHDQHDYLDGLTATHGKDKPIPHFHDRMLYCPRGSTWTIGGQTCMAMGGAYSIDKAYRVLGKSYWSQEMITQDDVDRVKGKHVDIMFTHDAPMTEYLEEWLRRFGYKVDHNSADNRHLLTQVVNEVRPEHLFHGHYHERYDTNYILPDGEKVGIHGVGANISPRTRGMDPTAIFGQNYLVVDLVD